MSSDTWVCPPGVTFIQCELWGAGAPGTSALPQAWRGNGGGGGAYALKRLAVTPGNSYAVTWGDGVADVRTTFDNLTFQALNSSNTNGAVVTPGADVSFAGGNGQASDFGSGVGGGGGGGGGRGATGGNGTFPTGGAGGTNSPSVTLGTGGTGGSSPAGSGAIGRTPGGGGGGMGGGGPVGPDLSGAGGAGAIIIYNDTDGGGFSATKPRIGFFGATPLGSSSIINGMGIGGVGGLNTWIGIGVGLFRKQQTNTGA